VGLTKLWTTGQSRPMVHHGPGGMVVALLFGDVRMAATGFECSPRLHREKEVGAVFTDHKRR
jgi:hypothetical protein